MNTYWRTDKTSFHTILGICSEPVGYTFLPQQDVQMASQIGSSATTGYKKSDRKWKKVEWTKQFNLTASDAAPNCKQNEIASA